MTKLRRQIELIDDEYGEITIRTIINSRVSFERIKIKDATEKQLKCLDELFEIIKCVFGDKNKKKD